MRTPISIRRRLAPIGLGAPDLTGGLISAGVSLASSAVNGWLNSVQLSHNADTATTLIVNRLAQLLQTNKDAYMSGPGTCADQAAALAAYDSAISWMQSPQACGNPSFGSAGNRCISDRIGSGAKWPWQAYYRDPIANDPRAASCAAQTAGTDAGEQSAIQNITNVVSGSSVQTTAGQFTPLTTPSPGMVTSAAPLSVAGIPSNYLLIGGGLLALILILKR